MSGVSAGSTALAARGTGVLRAMVFAATAAFSGLCMADPAAILRCRQESDTLLRLRCYDAIPLPSTVAGATAPGQANRPAPAQPAPTRPELVQGTGTRAAAASTDPTSQFGLESRPQAQEARPDAIESVIPGRFDGWVRGSRFRLANGQVWEIRDNSQGTYALNDPKVRISRGVSGSFFMEVAGVSQTPRVRRVE